jgi:hypothetical protein
MANEVVSKSAVKPENGIVTWDSEGQEGGRYHSRKLHVPTDASGLTLGRGYDMKGKKASTIVVDLTKVGVVLEKAEKISKASGLSGDAATEYITENKLEEFEITQIQQLKLFEITYDSEAAEAHRLCTKKDVTEKYGSCDWGKLNQAIKDMLVDLKFRGDYTGAAREKIQKSVVDNNLAEFAKQLKTRSIWNNVPLDRFNRRVLFLDTAIANQPPKPLIPEIKPIVRK